MASPPEVTIGDLSGKWVMNKSLSDDVDSTLALQGLSWFTRKAISLATVYLDVKQYSGPPRNDPDGAHVTHIDIQQTATGGIKGTFEDRVLDWIPNTHVDHIFGTIKGTSRWSTLEGVEDDYHKEGWLEGDEEKGGPNGEKHVETLGINEEGGWSSRQIWGFAIIDGERYYTRRIITIKGTEVRKIRLVYNFLEKPSA